MQLFCKYSFDTSAFIDGWERYYPPDIMPDLWEDLSSMIENGTIIITERVYEELQRHDNELSDWIALNKVCIVKLDENQISKAKELLGKYPKLVDVKKLLHADTWVVTLAITENCKVVTGERSNHLQQGKAPPVDGKVKKIPDVCHLEKIPCFDLVGFFRDMNWVFKRH